MTASENMKLPDTELWERASRGDLQAFEVLYIRYWSILLDEAYRRLKVREEAEEVVQEVFVTLYTRRESLVIRQNIGGYLHRAVQFSVYNRIRSYIVQRNYRRLATLRLDDSVDNGSSLVEYRELNAAVYTCIKRLPDKCRQVFLLSREQGLGYREIASELNISPHTVERHINRALKVLREEFGAIDAAPLVVLALTTGIFLQG